MSGDQPIRVVDEAPGFALPASDGRRYALADVLAAHRVVLVFYPGNNTPG